MTEMAISHRMRLPISQDITMGIYLKGQDNIFQKTKLHDEFTYLTR